MVRGLASNLQDASAGPPVRQRPGHGLGSGTADATQGGGRELACSQRKEDALAALVTRGAHSAACPERTTGSELCGAACAECCWSLQRAAKRAGAGFGEAVQQQGTEEARWQAAPACGGRSVAPRRQLLLPTAARPPPCCILVCAPAACRRDAAQQQHHNYQQHQQHQHQPGAAAGARRRRQQEQSIRA